MLDASLASHGSFQMTHSLRLVLASTAAAAGCSLIVALVVMASVRQPVLVTTHAASSSGLDAGVISSGDASVSKKPDVAFISVGVESQQASAAAAQSDLASKAAKLVARAKALGIADKDINTSGYSVGPVYSQNEQTISAYRASEQLQLKWHNVDTVGKTLDGLVQEGGATQVGVSFGLADPKAAQAEARTLAIADARSRAQAMAGAAGVKLGQLTRVSDLTFSAYPSANYSLKAADAVSTQLPVGELNVTVTVEVAYAIA
jgi:uncharacterized protein YggE